MLRMSWIWLSTFCCSSADNCGASVGGASSETPPQPTQAMASAAAGTRLTRERDARFMLASTCRIEKDKTSDGDFSVTCAFTEFDGCGPGRSGRQPSPACGCCSHNWYFFQAAASRFRPNSE